MSKSLKIIPIGGLDRIGMNIMLIETGSSMFGLDCGMAFPDIIKMHGIQKILPDLSYIQKNSRKLKGLVITHGHEDHIGSIPYFLSKVRCNIFCTPFTSELIKAKLKKNDMPEYIKYVKVIPYKKKIRLGNMTAEFIEVNHSIPDSACVFIETPVGNIFHTGDFKIDANPILGDKIDYDYLKAIGNKGIMLFMSDSTNADKSERQITEEEVGTLLSKIINENQDKRIIIATFSSNIGRVQQILNAASASNKKVILDGKSLTESTKLAIKMKILSVPDNTLIEDPENTAYKAENTIVICTGTQGEYMASIGRMSRGGHSKMIADQNDIVVFSGNPIPGNESAVEETINNLIKKGVKVIKAIHTSGHAYQKDLEIMYKLIHPKIVIPVHGDFYQRTCAAELYESLGAKYAFVVENGNTISFASPNKFQISGKLPLKKVYSDDSCIEGVTDKILEERNRLANSGIVSVYVNDKNIEIESRGFLDRHIFEQIKPEMEKHIIDVISNKNENLKECIYKELKYYCFSRLGKHPEIIVCA